MVNHFVPSFVWSSPTRIVYGLDTLERLPDEARRIAGDEASVLLVTGRIFLRSRGILTRVTELLANFEVVVHDRASPFPTPADADEAAAVCRESGADLVIGIGGGSALDLAKAAAVLALHDRPAKDYATQAASFDRPSLPFITVPTTSGSSSEVTSGSALWDWDSNSQFGLGDARMFPTVAIVDPRLSMSMSQTLAANTGMDALTSAFESYWSVEAEPLSDAIALEVIRTYSENLVRSAIQGDLESRAACALAANDVRSWIQQQHAKRLPRRGEPADPVLACRARSVRLYHSVVFPTVVRPGYLTPDSGAAVRAWRGQPGRGVREDRSDHKRLRVADPAVWAGDTAGRHRPDRRALAVGPAGSASQANV